MKKTLYEIKIAAIIVVVILMIFAAFNPSLGLRSNPNSYACKKLCVSNMKIIKDAAELYQKKNGTRPSITMNELTANGYLKTEPQCPPLRQYFLGFKIKEVTAPPYVITLSRQGDLMVPEIECQVHGKLSLQDSLDMNKGL